MKFTEAFAFLGYRLENHQNEWSSESDTGVCITLWKSELSRENSLPAYELDLSDDEMGPNHWTTKSGHKKRTRHLTKAEEQFGGAVDVVLLDGPPGGPYEGASPWEKSKRGYGWKVAFLNRETGEFRVEIDLDTKFPTET